MEGARILKGSVALESLDQIFTELISQKGADLPLFVAIDTESNGKERLLEIGISIFDPYCLLLPTSTDLDILNSRITTYCYAKGGSKNRTNYKPYRLGMSQPFQNVDVRRLFETHLTPQSSDGSVRKVVLVGHGIACDLAFLQRHSGLDLSQMSNIEVIMDTKQISRPVLAPTRPPSLKRILEHFQLDYIGLHNAAHDSRYTLRALLMLFVKFKQSQEVEQTEQWKKVTATMENIARCHKVRERRTWTPSMKTNPKVTPGEAHDIFGQNDGDNDDDEVSAILALLD